jgi:GNAT superfamily N-acetyltransferase
VDDRTLKAPTITSGVDVMTVSADPVHLFVTDMPTASDLAVVADSLDQFNVAQTGTRDGRPLAVLVRDPDTRRVVGGLTGRTSLGLFFVDLFYLPGRLRGAGLGREILQQAEAEARDRGCRTGVLYTISFQAPGFYARQGWRVFGEIPCDPPGTSRVFMTKELGG